MPESGARSVRNNLTSLYAPPPLLPDFGLKPVPLCAGPFWPCRCSFGKSLTSLLPRTYPPFGFRTKPVFLYVPTPALLLPMSDYQASPSRSGEKCALNESGEDSSNSLIRESRATDSALLWSAAQTRTGTFVEVLLLKCCFTFTETVGLLGTGAQIVHLDFHTAPELCHFSKLQKP